MPIWMWFIYIVILFPCIIWLVMRVIKNSRTKKILIEKLKNNKFFETSNFKIYIKGGQIHFLKKDTGYRNYLDDAGPIKEEIYSELRSVFNDEKNI